MKSQFLQIAAKNSNMEFEMKFLTIDPAIQFVSRSYAKDSNLNQYWQLRSKIQFDFMIELSQRTNHDSSDKELQD